MIILMNDNINKLWIPSLEINELVKGKIMPTIAL
jgi:hypothetical protein